MDTCFRKIDKKVIDLKLTSGDKVYMYKYHYNIMKRLKVN